MTAVDAVLFDLDDTLCTYRRSGADLLALSFDAVGVEPFFGLAEYHARYDEQLGSIEDMATFREECFAGIAEDAGRDPDLGRAVAHAYADERDQTNVEVLPGAREAVEALAGTHHLGLVTNGPPGMQRQKLAATGLADAFDVEVFAGFDAAAKPDPEPFHHALASLDLSADRAVHVGNSLRTDVPGANRAGLRSVWLRQEGATLDDQPRPSHVIDGLDELLAPPWA